MGGAVLTGAFAFAGVILAQVVIVWSQRRRIADEDARRWHAERRTLYAQFIKQCDDVDQRLSDAISERNSRKLPNLHNNNDYPMDATELEIRLLAPEVVVEAARALYASILTKSINAWRYALDGDFDEFSDEHDALEYEWPIRTDRMNFIEVARRDLMTPG